MRKTLTRLALAGAAVSSLVAGAALAQVPPPPAPPSPPEAPMPPPPPLPPMPPMDMMMSMGPDMMFMHQGRHADPEKRAQRLHDILQLRSDQDGLLKAYVEATTPKIVIEKRIVSKERGDKMGGDKMDGDRMERVERAPPTTLERLDHMTKAADAMKKRAEATRAFYTALTPAQQKTFDILGMGEGESDQHVFVRRFDTRAPMVKSDERKVVIQRKVG